MHVQEEDPGEGGSDRLTMFCVCAKRDILSSVPGSKHAVSGKGILDALCSACTGLLGKQ